MTAGPGDDMAAGSGHVRASRADRERAIDALKAAFVEERLTKDELDVRAGQAYTSRTYAELAAITADLPAAPRATAPRATAPRATAPRATAPLATASAGRPPLGHAKKVVLLTAGLTLQPILVVLAVLSGNDGFGKIVGISLPVYFIFVTGAAFALIDSLHERRKRSRGQAPPRPVQPPRPLECDHGDDPGNNLILTQAPRRAPSLGIAPA
jgi:Domain of unknown function (DUF1707)